MGVSEMLQKLVFLSCLIAILSGFSSRSDEMLHQLRSLPQHYAQFDVDLAWKFRAVDGKTVVSGVVRNVRYATMEDLEIWVALYDSRAKLLGRAVCYVVPRQLNLDDAAPFDVQLPIAASPGNKFIFTYKYNGLDGGGSEGMNGGGVNWMQSFESIVPPAS